MLPTSNIDTTSTPAAIMFAALSNAMNYNSATHIMRDMTPAQSSPQSGKRKRFYVGVRAADNDVQPDSAKEPKHAKHHHTFDSNHTYEKQNMASRQPSPPGGKRKRFSVGVRGADDDVELDNAKEPKHAKHSHGMVMDTEVSFYADPADPETIMEVDDPTSIDGIILDSSSASNESASSSIDVEMSDYAISDTSMDVEMSDNDTMFYDFDMNDDIELRDVVMENSLMYEPEVESASEDVMSCGQDSFDNLDDMITDNPTPAGRFRPSNPIISSDPIISSNTMNVPMEIDEPRATVIFLGVDVPTTNGTLFTSTVTRIPEVAMLENQPSLLQPEPPLPEAPRKENGRARRNAISVHDLGDMTTNTPTPAARFRPSNPIVSSNSVSSSNVINVSKETDKPKTTTTSTGANVLTSTRMSSTSTTTNIPKVDVPGNQQVPTQQEPPREKNQRPCRNAASIHDLVAQHMSATRYEQRRRSR